MNNKNAKENKINRILKNDYVLAFAITVIYALIVHNFSYISMAYDDVGAKTILSGALDNIYGSHIPFLTYIVSFSLSKLYALSGKIDWYLLFLVSASYYSLWAMLCCTIKKVNAYKEKAKKSLIICLLYSCLWYPRITHISFTYIACICGATFLFYYIVAEEQSNVDIIVEFIAITLCALIRFHVFKMIIVFGIVWGLYEYLIKKKKMKDQKLWIMIVSMIVVVQMTNYLGYNTAEYKELKAYHKARSNIQDYDVKVPEYEDHVDLYNKLNITQNEQKLLANGFWGVSEKIDSNVLKTLCQVYNKENPKSIMDIFKGIVKTLVDSNLEMNLLFFVFEILLLGLLFVLCRSNKADLYVIVVDILAWGAEWLYLSYRGRMPFRVVYIMHMTIILIFLGMVFNYLYAYTKENYKKSEKLCINGLVCALLLIATLISVHEIKNNHEKYEKNNYLSEMQDYLNNNSQNTYLFMGLTKEPEHFAKIINPSKENLVKCGGWISEMFEWKEDVRGEYSNMWEGFALNDRIKIITKADKKRGNVEDIVNYMNELGLDVEIDYEEIMFGDKKYWIWSMN